jgi:hypothetical protein
VNGELLVGKDAGECRAIKISGYKEVSIRITGYQPKMRNFK